MKLFFNKFKCKVRYYYNLFNMGKNHMSNYVLSKIFYRNFILPIPSVGNWPYCTQLLQAILSQLVNHNFVCMVREKAVSIFLSFFSLIPFIRARRIRWSRNIIKNINYIQSLTYFWKENGSYILQKIMRDLKNMRNIKIRNLYLLMFWWTDLCS